MNTEKIIKYLEQLELSPLEIKIYLTLLHQGEKGAQDLIKKLKVHRTSIYPPLESLFTRGLISKSVNGKQSKFSITDPEKSLRIVLEEFTTQKKEQLKEIELAFSDLLMQFPKIPLKEEEFYHTETKFYKGKAGVTKIYEDVLKAKEERSYVDVMGVAKYLPENITKFNDMLIKNPEIKVFEIYHNTPYTQEHMKFFEKHKNYLYKVLPNGTKLTAQDILIYENKIAIISFGKEISAVVLQNRDLYQTFKTLFDVMWNMLPEVKKERHII